MKRLRIIFVIVFLFFITFLSGCGKKYTVTFQNFNGDVLKEEIVKEGQSAVAPIVDERTGYEFIGWDSEYNNVKKDTIVIAKYKKIEYLVTFKDYDGMIFNTQYVKHGQDATPPADPVRDGRTFTGWDKDFTNVTSDLTITALYQSNEYIVTFKDYDGQTKKTDTIPHGDDATPPVLDERVGYQFIGWDKDYNNITTDLIITAIYQVASYQVVFKDYNDVILKIETVNHGESVTLPTDPVRVGYTFTGWDSNDYNSVTSDLTVVAQYQINTYTVTFVSNGGNEILPITGVEYNSKISLPLPTKDGNNFVGWYLSDDIDANNFTSNNVVTENITLYARWRIVELEYIIKDSQVIIVGYHGSKSELTIPDFIEGYPVKIIGPDAFKNNNNVNKLILPNGIETIGDNAFYNMTSLTKIVIPHSVTDFGMNILEGSTKVTELTMPGNTQVSNLFGVGKIPVSLVNVEIANGSRILSDNALRNANAVQYLTIPSTVVSLGKNIITGTKIKEIDLSNNIELLNIGQSVFYDADLLEKVILPNSLESIGDYAFYGTISLKDIIVPSNVTTIGNSVFKGSGLITITLSDNLTSIGESTFEDARSLTDIVIPRKITKVSKFLFTGAIKLRNVSLHDNITSIEEGAFSRTEGLVNITLPAALQNIDKSAFKQSAIRSITLPSGLKRIGDSAFFGSGLISITIPNTVETLGISAFEEALLLQEVKFEENTKLDTISPNAFKGCRALVFISIPSQIVTIGSSAFENAINLSSIQLNEGLNAIGQQAFKNVKIQGIIIPSSVQSIGDEAFRGSVYLVSVVIERSVEYGGSEIGIDVFTDGNNNLVVTLPEGSFDFYNQLPNWSQWLS